jgi:PAS domain S-box-containing protein
MTKENQSQPAAWYAQAFSNARALPARSTAVVRSIYRLLLEPFSSVRRAYDKRQSRFLAGLIFVIILVGTINEIFYTISEYANGYRGFAIVAAGIVVIFLCYLGARTRHYPKVAAIFIMLFSACTYFIATYSGPAPDYRFLIFLTLPIFMMGYFFPVPIMSIMILLVLSPMGIIYWTGPALRVTLVTDVLPILIFTAFISLILTRHRNLLEKDIVSESLAVETRFRRLLEQTFEANCTVLHGAVRHPNEKFLQMFGYTAAELELVPLRQLFLEEDLQPPESFQPGQIHELHAIRKDGYRFFSEIIIYGGEEESEQGWLLAVRDITLRKNMESLLRQEVEERKQKEAELHLSQAALRQAFAEKEKLLDSISSIIVWIDPEDHVLYWNQPAEQSIGLSAARAIGQNIFGLPLPWDTESMQSLIQRCRETQKKIRLPEIKLSLSNGNKRTLGMTANPISEPDSGLIGVLLFGSDITEQLIMQQQFEQRNKMESIGQLAAGVAHEINTPTQYIGNNLRFLRDNFHLIHGALPSQSAEAIPSASSRKLHHLITEFPNAISQSLDGIDRITHIVGALRDFSHPGSGKRSSANLNRGLESTVEVTRNEWKYIADVEMNLDPTLPAIDCLPGEINQVFLNIIINAVHAIHDAQGDHAERKGKIGIATSHTDQYVEIRISDTGGGIPAEIQNRVFDPFFTTKDMGRGTGQGLAISHTIIVQKHGGRIHFETETGHGTTFVIQLPIKSEITDQEN